MEVWQWYQEFERNAFLNGDAERLRLARLHNIFWQHVETNPQYSLTLLEEGVSLAIHLQEPCWELFHSYWRVEIYLFYLDKLDRALEYAVDLILTTRKPGYKDCPVVPRIHRILMDAYVYIDPIGYADKIRETMQHMETNMQLDGSTKRLIQARRVKLQEAFEDYDGAIAETHKLLAMSEYHPFRQAHAYHMLCYLVALQRDNDLAFEYACEMERLAYRIQRKGTLAMAYAWKCLMYQRKGYSEKAREFYRLATGHMSKLGTTPSAYYYDILSEYHELDGEITKALAVRDRQYEELQGRGAYHETCEYWLNRARLEGRNGFPIQESIKNARIAAQDLKKPAHYLDRLQRVIDDDYSDMPQNPGE